MSSIPLETALSPILKARVFRKTARTWHHDATDTILVINLQRSSYSQSLYVNLGIYLRSLGREPRPPCHRCHISTRLETVAPPSYFEAIRSLTVTSEPEPAVTEAVSHGVAWLYSLSTHAGISAFLATPLSTRMLVFATVRDLLGSSGPAPNQSSVA